jgi:hypothetical protein
MPTQRPRIIQISLMCIIDNTLTHLFGTFFTIQLHPQVWINDVDSIIHLAETYSKQPQDLRTHILIWLIMRLSTSYNNARHSYSIFSDLSLKKLIYAKCSNFLIQNQGESYSSIFKLLIAEAYGTYSTLIKILLEY